MRPEIGEDAETFGRYLLIALEQYQKGWTSFCLVECVRLKMNHEGVSVSSTPKVIRMNRTHPNISTNENNVFFDMERFREDVSRLLQELVMKITGSHELIGVRYEVGERTTQYFIDCPKAHIGRLMGNGGANINAVRIVVRAMMGAHGMRGVVEIPFYLER